MEIAKQMAGFSPAEADDLRKAVGKKKRDLMATMKEKFLEGLGASDTDRRVAEDLWSLMEAAADYSFNRSHAACYALIAYRTAWLRANYPAEYMAALISTVMRTKDKVPFFVNRCDEMGIKVLPPDVNASDHGFVVSGNSIRFGLDAVKNVGHAAVQAILDARSGGGRVHARSMTSASASTPARSTSGPSSAWSSAARSTRPAPPAGACSTRCRWRRPPARRPRRTRAWARARSSTSAAAAATRARRGPRPAPADRPRRVRPARAAAAGEGDAGDLPLLAPAGRGPRRAARAGRLPALGAGEQAGRLDRHRRRHRHRVQAPQDQAWGPDGLPDARRRRGPGRHAGAGQVLQRNGRVAGRRQHRARQGDGSTTRSGARPSSSPRSSSASSPPRTRWRGRGRRGPRSRSCSRIHAGEFGAALVDELKAVFEHFPGDAEVTLEMETREGTRRLRFGDEYRVRPSAALRAELDALLGSGARAA